MKIIFYSRTFIVCILLIFFNLIFYGCYSQREVAIENDQPAKIYKIEMLDGKLVDFRNNKDGFALLSNNKIISKKKSGEENTYQLSEVKKMYTEKFDYFLTFVCIIGSAAVLAMTILGLLLRGGGGLKG